MRADACRVVVVGPASWNTIVDLPTLPEPRPQTLFASASWSTLGGTSAGKALHLADLGVDVVLATVLGSDDEARLIRDALSHERIRLVPDQVVGGSERHLNLMAGSERLSIYLSAPSRPDGPLPGEARAAIEYAEHVVLDLSTRTIDAIPLARSSGATVWTDLHDYDGESDFHQPFLEAADIVFLSRDAVGDPHELMTRILATGKQLVVCTLGAEGAVALDGHGWHHVDAGSAAVVDTNGAGDAFLAGFLAATLASRRGDVRDALRAGAVQAVRALSSRHLSPLLDENPPG